jgi:hypothetical protein
MTRNLFTCLLLFVAYAQCAESAPVTFSATVIDDSFANGYQLSTADINRDGKPDIIALSTDPPRLVWYRNPDWQRFDITTKTKRNIDAAPYDIDGDGDEDLALASDFDLGNSNEGGTVSWLECPPNPEQQQEWTVHPIHAVPTSHRVRWANLMGDERKELVNLPIIATGAKAPEFEGFVELWVYPIPTEPSGNWVPHQVSHSLELSHAMKVAPWGHDGRDRLLVADFNGVNLFTPSTENTGLQHQILCRGHVDKRPRHGASEVDFGVTDDPEGMQFVATVEPWHGNEVVVYTPVYRSSQPWSRRVIDDTLKDGHALACANFNNDGYSEIVAGGRACGLFLYTRGDDGTWQRTDIDRSIAVAGVVISDINQDGTPDIIATGTGSNNVVWYAGQR